MLWSVLAYFEPFYSNQLKNQKNIIQSEMWKKKKTMDKQMIVLFKNTVTHAGLCAYLACVA